jgi:CYTH domain-containing protein
VQKGMKFNGCRRKMEESLFLSSAVKTIRLVIIQAKEKMRKELRHEELFYELHIFHSISSFF